MDEQYIDVEAAKAFAEAAAPGIKRLRIKLDVADELVAERGRPTTLVEEFEFNLEYYRRVFERELAELATP